MAFSAAITACLAVFMLVCTSTAVAQSKIRPDVGILTAVIDEFEAQMRNVKVTGESFLAGRVFKEGTIGKKRVVVVMTGIGLTNAAMTTQMLITRYNPRFIIFSGIAGGIDPALKVGDTVVPKAWANPQVQKFLRRLYTADGKPTANFGEPGRDFPNKFYVAPGTTYSTVTTLVPKEAPGSLPLADKATREAYAKTGVISTQFSMPMETEVLVTPKDYTQRPTPPSTFWFPVSKTILSAVAKAIPKIKLVDSAIVNGVNQSLSHKPKVLISERGVSTNTFVDNSEYREQLFARFKPSCAAMEDPAIMHVCASNKAECAMIRSLSDLAGGEVGSTQSTTELLTYLALATENSARVMKAVVAELP